MEMWFIIVVTLCISSILKSLFTLVFPSTPKRQLPPGLPTTLPLIGNLLWLINRTPFFQLGPIIRSHGPLVTLQIGSRPTIFVGSNSLARQALIQKGAVFASRPDPSTLPQNQLLSGNGRPDIGTSAYASTWRILRRNITSKILSLSSMKSYSHVRRRVLGILINGLKQDSKASAVPVRVVDHFQYAMFSILVLMCFGDDVHDTQIKLIETVQRRLILSFPRVQMLAFAPLWLRDIVFRKRWNHHLQLLRDQADIFIPLIRSRRHAIQLNHAKHHHEQQDEGNKAGPKDLVVSSYVDTLLDLQLPGLGENNYKKLDDDSMVGLCTEFMVGGTDTTTTALQWIMANLVKHPHIQAKLFAQINNGTIKSKEEEIKEEELHKFPYLKAVILEGLRRHPPLHFVIPHAVTEDVILDGYVIPKTAAVNFLVAEMGRDPNVWEDPLEFKPERFMSSEGNGGLGIIEFDITGSKEIKMMPFSAGRRICPGYSLALLHLEYFVANLVWNFEWKAVDGEGVDLSEKEEMTVEMKNPLRVHIVPRLK